MRARALVLTCLLAGLLTAPAAQAAKPWPLSTLQLGLADGESGASALHAALPQLGLRYQYLSGGVNTSGSWQRWGRGDGTFVSDYVADSQLNGTIPVFSYYELRQSAPGNAQSDESTAVLGNLTNKATMRAYYEDLKVVFQKAKAAGGPVVVQIEPDLWGYIERAAAGDDASTVPASVASSGMPDLQGIADNASGFAKAIVQLRDNYAPDVLLGWHVSIWGSGKDITATDETEPAIDELAGHSASFYASLRAKFDTIFAEFADRDSGYAEKRNGVPHDIAWWDDQDFVRHARFLADLRAAVGLPIVLWQIPVGNTLMRAMDDTPHHYQDNRAQYLLGPGRVPHLQRYLDAGVVALLFGPGQGDSTCACDAAHDGITNPAPLGPNVLDSLSADDDGGYLRSRIAAYYAAGARPLPASVVAPAKARRPTTQPKHAGAFTSRASAPASVRRGETLSIKASMRSSTSQTALFDLEVFRVGESKHVFQRYLDHQAFRRGHVRSFRVTWKVPTGLAPGDYVVKLGVFGVGFSGLRHWNDHAATFTVT